MKENHVYNYFRDLPFFNEIMAVYPNSLDINQIVNKGEDITIFLKNDQKEIMSHIRELKQKSRKISLRQKVQNIDKLISRFKKLRQKLEVKG